MTTSQPSAKRRRSKGLPIVSVISTLALLAGIVVGLAGPATSTPLTAPARALPAAAFPAPLCEGTDYTPASFMTTIDGVRLDHYNAGNIVPMYGNTARPDAPLAVQAPVCGVRQTSAGPESEWMYCTDYTLDACSGIDPETGLPVDKHNGELGPTVPVSGHPGLTDDQNLIISWVLQNPVETSFGVADDQNSDNRVSRQALVWCVTDYDQFTSFCDGFFPASAQATILSRIQADPTMELALTDPTTGTVATGGTATFTLTTNLYETPITLTLPAGASITVCADGGNATLTGSQIVVHGSGSTPAAIRLCVTDPDGGTTELSAAVSPPSVENLHWNTAGDQCQVFASFDTVQPNSIEAAASVVFDTKPTTTTAPTTTTTVPTTTDVTTTAPTTTEPEVTTTAPTTTTDVTTTTAPTT
ncbi:hypothetical protein, partial [Rhodococcus sp. IEGM 1379]|uniref:hypothetical protein n=1 Tax=Rhodococcus sp. IEGM 1379 TaxID=3047086 RepID=UPI0024B7F4F8